ncbi:MAG: DEAD/DEAH box helicase, partial [Caldilineaceae bacterium]|nr:DEAD/DEAH box helicase [Caldilineaceae bacterium]
MNTSDFSTLPLAAAMVQNLHELGFVTMTPVQAQSLPAILQNRDVIAQAKTGSGKTVAFGLGALNKLDVDSQVVQSLVLCPTRELADQVATEVRRLARFTENIKVLTLCGGRPSKPQRVSLEHGAHIVVGTPGRILQHLQSGALTLESVNTLVLDEAHRMLDMGFIDQIAQVIAYVPSKRQTLLFSATYPDEILALSAKIQHNAVKIETITVEQPNPISEYFYQVAPWKKLDALVNVLAYHAPENAIVFTTMKSDAQELAAALQARSIHALALHGDL